MCALLSHLMRVFSFDGTTQRRLHTVRRQVSTQYGKTKHMNPAPWPSFGHVGAWYAGVCSQRILDLSVPTIFLQRWWRQHSLLRERQKLYPIVIGRWAYNVKDAANRINELRGDEGREISMKVMAYEKLYGTNLGVRCDGAVFGRRIRVDGDSYQKVALKAAIPTQSSIQAVKSSIESTIRLGGFDNDDVFPMLVLYGELMCNPKKYGYEVRGMARKFFCFGAVFDPIRENDDTSDAFCGVLKRHGFAAQVASGKIRVRMNDKLSELVQSQGISCAPLLDQGPLREVCFRLEETMKSDDKLEGVVLHGDDGCLFKWKTRTEDESKGYDLLCSLNASHSLKTLELAGVDVEVVGLLTDVAKKEAKAVKSAKGLHQKNQNKTKQDVYDDSTMEMALVSAMSKYDALEVYFERGEMPTILETLKKEVIEDLGARTEEEKKFITRVVGRKVGCLYGKWKK